MLVTGARGKPPSKDYKVRKKGGGGRGEGRERERRGGGKEKGEREEKGRGRRRGKREGREKVELVYITRLNTGNCSTYE